MVNAVDDFSRMTRLRIIMGVMTLLLVLATDLAGADERRLPEDIQSGLQYLMALNSSPQERTVAPRQLTTLVEFILEDKPSDDQYYGASDPLLDPIVYHEFELRRPLSTILEYAFHPKIPSHVFALSSVRHAFWKEVDGRSQPLPSDIVRHLDELSTPLVIHGIEHEEITPDLNSGAYYSYDLARTLIMCRVTGRKVWISLARQRDKSDVGRKGIVLGPDEDWDYLYTGEKGIDKMGLGWVESYMYEGFSAIVIIQENDDQPRVRCGIFRWLRAGWNDLNFVRRSHIRRGLERYAETFRQILESPRLPSPDQISAAAATIGAMSAEQLHDRGRQYLQSLKTRYGGERKFPDKWFAQAVEDGPYLHQLSRAQLEAMVFLEYMKKALGQRPDQGPHLAMEPITGPGETP